MKKIILPYCDFAILLAFKTFSEAYFYPVFSLSCGNFQFLMLYLFITIFTEDNMCSNILLKLFLKLSIFGLGTSKLSVDMDRSE